MTRRKLPTGIQTFREIREDGYYYVDKTPHISRLFDYGKYYFLSRPRRFGKSLLVDTIKELFRGLYIHDRWDWSVRDPVVRLDFGGGDFREAGSLSVNLGAQFDEIERDAPIERRCAGAPERFGHLLRTLHRGTRGRLRFALYTRCVEQRGSSVPSRSGGGTADGGHQPPARRVGGAKRARVGRANAD